MKMKIKRLRADKRKVADTAVAYRLFRIRNTSGNRFAIKVSTDDESATCDFGCDYVKAFDIYTKIVRSEVTPCSLCDIAEDFAKSV